MDPDKTDMVMVGFVIAAAALYLLKTMMQFSDLVDNGIILAIIALSSIAIGYLVMRFIR